MQQQTPIRQKKPVRCWENISPLISKSMRRIGKKTSDNRKTLFGWWKRYMFPRVEQPVNSKIAMCPGAEEAPSASRKHREIYLFFKQLPQVLKYHHSWHETKILTAIKVTRIEPLDLLRNICNKCWLCDVLWVLCLCVWFLVLFRCWLADYIRGCNCIAWCHSISEENATDCLAWNRVELAIRKTCFSQAMQTLGIDKFFRKKKL